MLAHTIDVITALDPFTGTGQPLSAIGDENLKAEVYRKAEANFMARYAQLDAGWIYAARFAHQQCEFPVTMLGRDRWVHDAYLMILDPVRYFNRNIAEALMISQAPPGADGVRSIVRAYVLTYNDTMSHDYHLRRVANYIRMDPETLFAFESLFFNVFDRRMDSLCIGMNLYPQGRLVEFDENYFKNTPTGEMLERAAYNLRDIDLVHYMSGIGDRSYMSRLAASENRETELTNYIMGNALMMTKMNLLNHRGPGWGRAASLLAAQRQGGGAIDAPPLFGLGGSFMSDLKAVTDIQNSSMADFIRSSAREAAHTTVDV